jgi:ppGpp synthetase/RelA/SpoT-type nucleotidyltranferase
VPLPISKQQLNKLGQRIAASETPTGEDAQQLNNVLRAYQAILVTVEEQLAALGLSATSRVKTKGVLIEKLQREQGMLLARVQDMAGARLVIEGGWAEQDVATQQLTKHFDTWTGKASKVVDRRVNPSHGYRAVHVIVFPEGVPVEIQVRTELQNHWAQIVERLADRWGRGVRYGDDPEDAQLPAEGVRYHDGSPVTRQRIIYDLRDIADQMAEIEAMEHATQLLKKAPYMSLEQRIEKAFGRETVDLDEDACRYYPSLRKAFKRTVSLMASQRAPIIPRKGWHTLGAYKRHAGRLVRRLVPNVRPSDAEFVRDRIAQVGSFVDDLVDEQRSLAQHRQARLRTTLQGLGQYVEQGGIR